MANNRNNRNNNRSNGQRGNNTRRGSERRYGEGQDYKRDGMDDPKRFPNSRDLKGKTKGRNDIAWYRPDSQVMKDAANLSFATTMGLPFDLADADGGIGTVKAVDTMPGIMTMFTVPTFGPLNDWSSPFNVAVRDMYTFIRHANSGHSNYDAANLGMYLMAYDSAATFYAWMVRLYGLTRTVLVQNAYTPKDLVTAAGGNYHSLVTNLADFRGYINSYAVRLNAMRVPSKWHILERHMWQYTHVFADSPTNKASFYIFRPACYWKYTLAATPTATGLSPFAMTGLWDLAKIKDAGETLLNSILNDEDFNIMSGDILKAYAENTFSLNLISEDYAVMPVYDQEVLMQIHNASMILSPSEEYIAGDVLDSLFIHEDTSETTNVGALIMDALIIADNAQTEFTTSLAYCCMKRLLDVPSPNPDPAMVCTATRFMINMKNGAQGLTFEDFGTEIIVGAFMMTAPNSVNVGSASGMFNTYDLEKFDWHPYIYRGSITVNQNALTSTQMTGIYGDIDNYAVISHSTLSNIHRAAMLGMFEMV